MYNLMAFIIFPELYDPRQPLIYFLSLYTFLFWSLQILVNGIWMVVF